MKLLLGRYDDRWYRSLFQPGIEKLTGEITPSYSILKPQDVAHIKAQLPELKILFVMRNPVERTWSQIRYYWMRTGNTRDVSCWSAEKMTAFIEHPVVWLRADYLRTIEIWRNYFPQDQFFVGFYDDLADTPAEFLQQVFEFLDIETTGNTASARLTDRINASPAAVIPSAVKLMLTAKYYDQIRELSAMFGGHASTWLREAERTLDAAA